MYGFCIEVEGSAVLHICSEELLMNSNNFCLFKKFHHLIHAKARGVDELVGLTIYLTKLSKNII